MFNHCLVFPKINVRLFKKRIPNKKKIKTVFSYLINIRKHGVRRLSNNLLVLERYRHHYSNKQ
jgi:hypothetical protein